MPFTKEQRARWKANQQLRLVPKRFFMSKQAIPLAPGADPTAPIMWTKGRVYVSERTKEAVNPNVSGPKCVSGSRKIGRDAYTGFKRGRRAAL